MSPAQAEVQLQSFVVLPLGSRKLALSAESVIELVAPVREQKFPHGTPWLSGVLVRRGRVVPICDIGRLLGEPKAASETYYLIAKWPSQNVRNWCAIPVTGECELTNAETNSPAADSAAFIAGQILFRDEQIEILDLGKLIREQESAFHAGASEPKS
jgi:chemotaxis signal transduction protein